MANPFGKAAAIFRAIGFITVTLTAIFLALTYPISGWAMPILVGVAVYAIGEAMES